MSDLTPEEEAELKALRAMEAPSSDLTPEEKAELKALRAEEAPKAPKASGSFVPDGTATRIDPKEYTGPVEYGPAFQIAASVPLLGSAMKAANVRFNAAVDPKDGEDYDQALARNNKKFASDRDAFDRDYPGGLLAASVLGSFALPAGPFAKAAGSAAKAAGAAAGKVPGLLSKTASGLGKLLPRAGYNMAEAGVDSLLMNEDVSDAGGASATSGAITLGTSAFGAAGKAFGTGLSRMGGVTPEVAKNYMENATRVNDLDFNKIVNRYIRRQDIANRAGENAGNQATKAKGAHDLASKQEVERLRRVGNLTEDDTSRELAQKVMDARAAIGTRMGAETPELHKILDRDIKNMPWDKWTSDIEQAIAAQKKTRGVGPDDEVLQFLREWQVRLARQKGSGSGGEVAKNIQEEMGNALEKAYLQADAKQYVNKSDHPLMNIRQTMRKDLGTASPDFDARMKVREVLTQNKTKVDDWGGDSISVGNMFPKLANPKYAGQRQLLDWLGKETGQDLVSPLKPSENARELLRLSNRGKHLETLPTFKDVERTSKVLSNTKAEQSVFSQPLRTRIQRAGKNPDNQEALHGLQQVGDRMGFNAKDLAKDLHTQEALSWRAPPDPNLTAHAQGWTMQALNRAAGLSSPAWKKQADIRRWLDPSVEKARKRNQWLLPSVEKVQKAHEQFGPIRPKLPRALVSPWTSQADEDRFITEED